MAEEKTYLELSQTEGSSHKFYEVIVNDTQVTIRYGRIGDSGQTQTKTYPTPEKAKADATKKINALGVTIKLEASIHKASNRWLKKRCQLIDRLVENELWESRDYRE